MLPDSPLEARTRGRLAALSAGGMLRALAVPAGVDLSSNDYLGLSRHPAIVDAAVEGVRRHGVGSTGSRLLRGHRDAFFRVEQRFAAFKGAEASLYFSTGYLANLAVLTTLAESGDTIFSDERNHASLIDGTRLSRAKTIVFPHNDATALSALLAAHRRTAPAAAASFVVVESLFSMDGDAAPLAEYAAICRAHGAVLIVDEAHAVGVFGQRGSGLIEAAGDDTAAAVCVSVNTAGKALGAAGAFVAGPSWAIDYLTQRARTFVFTTAAPPALAEALEVSLAVVEQEPQRRARVQGLAGHLRRALSRAGLLQPAQAGGSQIVPVVLGANDRAVAVAAVLQREGFDVRAIRPPSVPEGTARLRISVNALLDEPTLDRFVEALGSAVDRTPGADASRMRMCSAASS
jgi:8-amino-7-oxononanoate synthase